MSAEGEFIAAIRAAKSVAELEAARTRAGYTALTLPLGRISSEYLAKYISFLHAPAPAMVVTQVRDDGWCLYSAFYEAYTGLKASVSQAQLIALAMAKRMEEDPLLQERIAGELQRGIVTQEVALPSEANKRVVNGVSRRVVKTLPEYIAGLITPRRDINQAQTAYVAGRPESGPQIWPDFNIVRPYLQNLVEGRTIPIAVYRRGAVGFELEVPSEGKPRIKLLHTGGNHFDILDKPAVGEPLPLPPLNSAAAPLSSAAAPMSSAAAAAPMSSAAAPLSSSAAAPNLLPLAQEAMTLQGQAEAAAAALRIPLRTLPVAVPEAAAVPAAIQGTAIPVRVQGQAAPAAPAPSRFSRFKAAFKPSTNTRSPVGRLSEQNLDKIRNIVRREVADALAKTAPVTPYVPKQARIFPPSIQALLDRAVTSLPLVIPAAPTAAAVSKKTGATTVASSGPMGPKNVPSWAQWALSPADVAKIEGDCKTQEQCIINAILDETHKGAKFIAEDRLSKRGDKRLAAYEALQAEYAAKKAEVEADPSQKGQAQLSEIEEKLRARYADGGVDIVTPSGQVQHFIVPNPYVAKAYREEPTVTFGAPAEPQTKQAMNVAVLQALVPTEAREMIDNKEMAIALLESLWFCGANPTLSDDPRCFPLRLLGELREYAAMKEQQTVAVDAQAILAKPWGVLQTWMVALKNALGKEPINPYPSLPATVAKETAVPAEMEKEAAEIESRAIDGKSPAELEAEIQSVAAQIKRESAKLLPGKVGQERLVTALLAYMEKLVEAKGATTVAANIGTLPSAVEEILKKNKASAALRSRLEQIIGKPLTDAELQAKAGTLQAQTAEEQRQLAEEDEDLDTNGLLREYEPLRGEIAAQEAAKVPVDAAHTGFHALLTARKERLDMLQGVKDAAARVALVRAAAKPATGVLQASGTQPHGAVIPLPK